MKRTLPVFLLLFFSTQILSAQSIIRTPMGEVLGDLAYFTSLHPRLEGSEQEKAAYLYIKSVLDELGSDYTEHTLGTLKNNHSFSSSIIVNISGVRRDTLNVVVPLDHHPGLPAAKDGAVSLALGLSLVREFSPRKPDISLRILFLGAEFSGPAENQLGSGEFLREFYPDDPQSFLYLDIKTVPRNLALRAGGEGIVAPYWQVQRTINALESSGMDYRFREDQNQIHRLRMWGAPTRINPYLKAGYPALSLEETDGNESPAVIPWITSFYTFFFALIENNSTGFPEQWDKHYLYFNILGKPVSIGEMSYIYLLLAVIITPLVYPFFMPRRFNRYLRTLRRNFWDIPVLLILIFLFLVVGTYGIRLILLLRGFPTLWEYTPVIAFIIKASIAMILFFLFFGILKKIRFSQNSTFYSSSAIFMILLAILTVSVLDISMTNSLLWAFGFAFIFSIVPNKYVKALLLVASTLLVLKSLYDVFSEGAVKVIDYLILSPLWGNIFLSLLVLPFLLMLIRLDFLFRHPALMRQKVLIRNAAIIFGSITMIGILYLFGYTPYDNSRLQPVSVTEEIISEESVSHIHISSPAGIDALMLSASGIGQEVVNGVRETEITRPVEPHFITPEISRENFLDRDRFRITLVTSDTPEYIEITFSGTEGFLVYDMDFPYTISPERNSAQVHIGYNPPLPLTFEAVFLADTAETMKIRAIFTGPFEDLGILGALYSINQTRIVTRDISLLPE